MYSGAKITTSDEYKAEFFVGQQESDHAKLFLVEKVGKSRHPFNVCVK